MLYCNTSNVELVTVHPDNNPHESHYISIETNCDMPVFTVSCCCDEEWEWTFWYNKTNYDIAKHLIMDCVFASETMEELIDAMDEAFYEYLSEVVFDEEEGIECDAECCMCGSC